MSIRGKLKEREEARDKANGPGINEGLPEGVTRYVYLSKELADGKNFAILTDPDNWYFYYVHEDGDFATRSTYFQKHTCLHSPKKAGYEQFDAYKKPNKSDCLSCKAGAKRKLYFMIPVYDFEYKTWRVLDFKEFHVNKVLGDYDKLEKAAKKFNKEYSLVGDVVTIGKSSDGKSYTLEAAETDGMEDAIAEAAKLIGTDVPYEELAHFRDEDSLREILEKADDSKVDKSVLGAKVGGAATAAEYAPIPDDGAPLDISEDDLPF